MPAEYHVTDIIHVHDNVEGRPVEDELDVSVSGMLPLRGAKHWLVGSSYMTWDAKDQEVEWYAEMDADSDFGGTVGGDGQARYHGRVRVFFCPACGVELPKTARDLLGDWSTGLATTG